MKDKIKKDFIFNFKGLSFHCILCMEALAFKPKQRSIHKKKKGEKSIKAHLNPNTSIFFFATLLFSGIFHHILAMT